LLDVALGRCGEAVAWLKRAYQSASHSGEVAASYAHALARMGRLSEARKVLARASKRGASREHAALLRWLEQGAPPDKDHGLARPVPVRGSSVGTLADTPVGFDRDHPRSRQNRIERAGSRRAPHNDAELDCVLDRGLACLPLDARQRARAKTLARDVLIHLSRAQGAPARGGVEAIAAAVAYAIVYVDHVPLTQSEVAACFRVGVASLRGRFAELRAQLDLLPGDARYATFRR
jgi:hypothetical protein